MLLRFATSRLRPTLAVDRLPTIDVHHYRLMMLPQRGAVRARRRACVRTGARRCARACVARVLLPLYAVTPSRYAMPPPRCLLICHVRATNIDNEALMPRAKDCDVTRSVRCATTITRVYMRQRNTQAMLGRRVSRKMRRVRAEVAMCAIA